MPTAQLKPDSLAFALQGASLAVLHVREGQALPHALARVFTDLSPSPQARGAMQDIAYRSLRLLGSSDALLTKLTEKPAQPAALHYLLTCALALLQKTYNDRNLPYEAFTVVDQAVTAAAAHPATAKAKGMVNAVLRRYLREQTALQVALETDPVAKWNYPRWWIDEVRSAYPTQWEAILAAGNQAPPLTLRVNRSRMSVDAYIELAQERLGTLRQIGPEAVRLDRPVPVAHIPLFAEGVVSVQDAAAQLGADLLHLQDGMRVLDACAAPGGKTGHILELANVDLTALDSDPTRAKRITENLERLQRQAHVIIGDAAQKDWWDGRPFDRILADVPCTASGIVRRHPDIRWLRRKSDAAKLAKLAASILDNLWTMLQPGGQLLLVTCSIWPQESEAQAAAFAQRHQAIRLAAPGQLLPQATAESDHDGLFYALFQKSTL